MSDLFNSKGQRIVESPLPSRAIDLTGKKVGGWTVLRFAGHVGINRYWICRCDCGSEMPVRRSSIATGRSRSCGCQASYNLSRSLTKHDMSRSPEYSVWAAMKARCGNPKNPEYDSYGGRGISVCPAWINSFEAFIADVGRRPSDKHSIERINVDGNYEPENVKWATSREQARNTRRNIFVEWQGRRQCLLDWARELGISHVALRYRLRRMPLEKAMAKGRYR